MIVGKMKKEPSNLVAIIPCSKPVAIYSKQCLHMPHCVRECTIAVSEKVITFVRKNLDPVQSQITEIGRVLKSLARLDDSPADTS